ncbi:MAG: TolC family protein [Candidatus Rokuibacteriota bacterium]
MKRACLVRSRALPVALGLGLWLTPLVAGAQPPAAAPPSPVAGRLLPLPEAIKIALETQPTIQSRLADYAAAQQRVKEALSAILPQLGGSWLASRQQTQFFSSSIGGGATKPQPLWSTTQSAQLTLSQILFDFGQTFAATDVAKAQSEVARLDAEVQKDQIILAVKEGYFNLLLGKRLVVVNQEAIARAELNLRSAKGFFEVGTRPKIDVVRAEVTVANAELGLIQARNAVRLARVALNTAMGIAVNTPTEVEDILTYEAYGVDQDKLIPEALRQRPEYLRVNTVVTSAEASVRQAFRNFFPVIQGTGAYGGTFRSPTTPDDLAETWQLGVQLTWTILDGGNKIARYQETQKILESGRSQVKTIELSVSQEVVTADLNLNEAKERLNPSQKGVESAKENFRLAKGRFDAGVGTIIDLTDAQFTLTQAEATLAQTLADYRIGIARLERALGRR